MNNIVDVLSSYPSSGHSILLGFAYGKRWVQSVCAYLITQYDDSPKYVLSESGLDCLCSEFYRKGSSDITIPAFYPVRMERSFTIVSNGAQTDMIKDALSHGKSDFDALHFPPKLPSHPFSSPYISGIRDRYGHSLLSISKVSRGGAPIERAFYEYHWTQTSYFLSSRQEGKPVPFYIKAPTSKLFAEQIWDNLDPAARVSLFVRYIDQRNGFPETVIINQFGKCSYSTPKTPIWPTRRNRK